MNNGYRVETDKMDNAFWENILQNFNNNETITDFQTLQNIANRVSYIHPEKCALEYGMTEGNGSDDRSKMPNSGNQCTDDSQRLDIFQQTVNNYQHIWDKLDNREKNFVYTCVCGGYVDTLGLFFLNRLQRNNMVTSQEKYFNNMFIDIETNDLTNLPESDFPGQDYSQYQNEDFGLPKAYHGNLDGNQFGGNLNNDQLDVFPTLENHVEKLFEECKSIHKKVQRKIGLDIPKNERLNKLWVDLLKKKRIGNCDEMLSLCKEMKKLIYY